MMTTRYSVRTYDHAGHPLRRRVKISAKPLLSREPLGDLQLFAMAFSAGFLAFYGFLS